MSGIAGPCDRECKLGRPHQLDCRNYIEVDLPCPVCASLYGHHLEDCILARTPRETPDGG